MSGVAVAVESEGLESAHGDTCVALEPKVSRCCVSIAEAVVLPSESAWGVTQTSACRRGGVGGVAEAHVPFAARAAF